MELRCRRLTDFFVAPRIQKEIEKVIEEEVKELHKPLVFIEEHNKEQDILYKEFYNPSASREENYSSFQEFRKYHYQFFKHEFTMSFEDWEGNPLRLYDLSREYEFAGERDYQDDSDQDEPITKIEILEEMIECIMKELNINIDVDEIIRCKTNIKNSKHLTYEKMDNNAHDISIAASRIKLNNHDFIIKKEG